jgi:PAS domain S-box-containing protein
MATQNQINTSYETILKQAGRQKVSIFRFSKTYPAYIILIIMLSLSFLVKDFFEQQVTSENKAAFDKAVTSVVNRLENKEQKNTQILNSFRSIYDNEVQVVRDYFYLYSSVPVKTNPSIRSILYVEKVPASRTSEFEISAQGAVYSNYKIKSSGVHQYYEPILLIVPREKNEHLLGVDMDVNPIISGLLNKSCNNNQIVASQVFDVRQPDTLGFYLIGSVYKQNSDRSTVETRKLNYAGSVLIEIDPQLYYEEALGEGIASDTTIVFNLFDINNNKENLIFSSKNSVKFKDYDPDYAQEIEFKIADHPYKIKFASIPNFTGSFQKFLPMLSFIISIVLSFAFFAFILAVTTSQARAIDIAERLTRSQRRIVDSSKDIIAVMDLTGVWKSMNPASAQIFGYEPNEMLGQKIDLLFNSSHDIKSLYNSIENVEEEITERMDFLMNTGSGYTKWINWSFTISKTDGLVYCIGRDVTLEKIAEEQNHIRTRQSEVAEHFTREASESKSLFMIKLSHQLRNSLTGILGYLSLLSNKLFDNEDERDNYISLAEESSEELFNFVSDIDEISYGSDNPIIKELNNLKFSEILISAKDELVAISQGEQQINLSIDDEGDSARIVADFNQIKNSFIELLKAFSAESDKIDIMVAVTKNIYEGALEIQVMSSPNPIVTDIINIYKQNSNNLIDALKSDKKDILFHFAIAASNFRMLNGNMILDTLGEEEGNIVQITLPLTKKN